MGGNRTPIIDNNSLYHSNESWVEDYHQHLINGGKPQGLHEAPAYLRRLTINEAAILQTFPSNYKFVGANSKIYSQIGNAAPCALANAVANCVKDSLAKKDLTMDIAEQGEKLELALS